MKKRLILILAVMLVVVNGGMLYWMLTQDTDLEKVKNLKTAQKSEQLILVTADNMESMTGVCNIYEKENGKWTRVFQDIPAVLGERGLNYDRKEGDKTTPAGSYAITMAFGLEGNPGTRLPYRVINPDDYWVGDHASPYYNTWQNSKDEDFDTEASEHLMDYPREYKYGFVFDFNKEQIMEKGFALFFHTSYPGKEHTSGCIAVSEKDMVSILKWLDPGKNPRIIIAPEDELDRF